MSEDSPGYPTYNMSTTSSAIPTTNGEVPPAKRNGSRGLLPGSWLGRPVRISYTDAHGKGVETSGTLLDFCGTGPIFNLSGARVLLAWDKLVLLELASD